MNTTKLVAVVAATLITTAGVTGIATFNSAAIGTVHAAVNAAPAAATLPVTTLPVTTVRPTAAQLLAVRRG